MKNHITLIIFTCILVGIAASLIILNPINRQNVAQTQEQPSALVQEMPAVATTSSAVTFTWIFEKAAMDNPDGIPKTNVALEVKYADGSVVKKNIETVDGSCNALADKDADSVASSTKIQCYAAGFGQWFKVTKGDGAYNVQRKNFEESTPEQTPTNYAYETLATFPF